MKPRNVIVTMELRNDIPARVLEGVIERVLAQFDIRSERKLGLVEAPKANVIRNRRCLDPAANGPAPKAAVKAAKKPATKKPTRKLVAPARKRVR